MVINRPISTGINVQLAKVLLEGNDESGKGKYEYDFIDRFVQAFRSDGIVYNGGPHAQAKPAMLIHGIPELEGATEIAPGMGIFRGGVKAAVEGILEGKYTALEFRFFLGKYSYNPEKYPERGALLSKIKNCEYQPVACSRALALKQCLRLPKPLWHEGTYKTLHFHLLFQSCTKSKFLSVLELCGGELRALSNVELRKRVDLK